MLKDFIAAVESRRSIYSLTDEQVIPNQRITQIVEHALRHSPSAFNSQSARTLVLYGDHHKKLWSMTKEILRAMVPIDNFEQTDKKINSFYAGYGTVLFFEDQDVIADLQMRFPSYAHTFPLYSLQSSGMIQYIIWTALENEGLGASLQHYDPLIDEVVRKEWNIPSSWKLHSELVFGKPAGLPLEKSYQPIERRMRVFN